MILAWFLDLDKSLFLIFIKFDSFTTLPSICLTLTSCEQTCLLKVYVIIVFTIKVKGVAILLKPLMNCWYKFIKPINIFILQMDFGFSHFLIVLIFFISLLLYEQKQRSQKISFLPNRNDTSSVWQKAQIFWTGLTSRKLY